MTQQEKFEADYRAACPKHGEQTLAKSRAGKHVGRYVNQVTRTAFRVWSQQAHRHETEVTKFDELTDRQSVHISDLASELAKTRAKADRFKRLLAMATRMLERWAEKYGPDKTTILPPSGHVTLLEDIETATTEGGEK